MLDRLVEINDFIIINKQCNNNSNLISRKYKPMNGIILWNKKYDNMLIKFHIILYKEKIIWDFLFIYFLYFNQNINIYIYVVI